MVSETVGRPVWRSVSLPVSFKNIVFFSVFVEKMTIFRWFLVQRIWRIIMDNVSTISQFTRKFMIGKHRHPIFKRNFFSIFFNYLFCSYTFAGDICIIKVYFNSCDKPRLSPIRVIIDEITAQNGIERKQNGTKKTKIW